MTGTSQVFAAIGQRKGNHQVIENDEVMPWVVDWCLGRILTESDIYSVMEIVLKPPIINSSVRSIGLVCCEERLDKPYKT